MTIALPRITPSDTAARSRACSGVEIPNPTAHGIDETALAWRIISEMFVLILLRIPVTPSEDTQ
ncbi:hypothetical protein FACS1894211_01150 [Clostridia bacterium]|nr:hypothetical protein FACS1894211_01150 [Clostridia bacterium]